MQLFNYHTHTYRCGHATGTDKEYVEAAIKAGYRVLGFSDHAPYKEVSLSWARMDWYRLEDYIDSVNSLKKAYEGKIEIRLGLETEFFPEYLEEKKELADKVEYLILGQHFSNPQGDGSYFGYNTDVEILEYARKVCEGLDTGLFMYLAHPDVFMNKQREFTPACEKAARMIAEKAVQTNTPLEINVHGVTRGKQPFPNGERYYYPHRDFWKIMAQYPVKCLYGVDAHRPEQILSTEDVAAAEREMEGLGLQFIREPLL